MTWLLSGPANAAREFNSWDEFDLPNPPCERAIALGVGRESFFEIANEVVGKEEFNSLIRLFNDRKWLDLEAGIQGFLTKYEKTPLREAASFLRVQALFDKSEGNDEDLEKKAERELRGVLLLYPKSDFAPVMAATAGAYWLRTRNYQKSLASYEVAKANYSKHPLFCTYLMGIAETHFLLRDWKRAESAISETIQSCQNFRLRAAALVRQVDIDRNLGKPGIEQSYETLVENESPFLERFYQPVLANLAELKFSGKKWKESAYYFNQYLAKERLDAACLPLAGKRLADIAARLSEPPAAVVGKYLAVYDKYPKTDVGRFSYAHGLLIDPSLRPGAELDRRVVIADEQAEKLGSEELRSRIFVEKALTLLEFGEVNALDLLLKIRTKSEHDVQKGKVGEFIRSRAYALLEAGKVVPTDSAQFLPTLEQYYRDWFKGSSKESASKQLYGKVLAEQFARLLREDKFSPALALITQWRSSELWPSTGVPSPLRLEIGNALLKELYSKGDEGPAAVTIAESQETLAPFLEPEYRIVNWLARIQLAKGARKSGVFRWERSLASTAATLPGDKRVLFKLASASGLRLSGDYSGAESALQGLKGESWEKELLSERLQLALVQKQSVKAYGYLKTLLSNAPADQKSGYLKRVNDFVISEKLWRQGTDLANLAASVHSNRAEQVPYLLSAARSYFELNQFKECASHYENAMVEPVPASDAPESRFRFGKCLVQLKKKEAARTELQKVVDAKDLFWSPLAQSEIRLMEP
jgi:hypothetical protein